MGERQDDPRVEQFRQGFARMAETGELPWELFDDRFVWDMSQVPWAERAEYVGREGVSQFMRDWSSAWEKWRLEPVEFLPIGDQMVVVSHQTARAKESGVPVEMTHAQIWSADAEQGKMTRARMFESREQAIAVAEAEALERAPSRSRG